MTAFALCTGLVAGACGVQRPGVPPHDGRYGFGLNRVLPSTPAPQTTAQGIPANCVEVNAVEIKCSP